MKIEKAKETLDLLYEKYESTSDSTISDVTLDGSQLKKSLANQIELMVQWEGISSEVKSFQSIVQSKVDDAYSDAIRSLLTDNHKSFTISEAKEIARCDASYREWRNIRLDTESLYNEVRGILEVIQSRKYILNNITNAVVASQENHII